MLFLGQTLGFAQGLGDDPLQLAVGAAEFIRSPGLYRIHRLSVNAEDKTLDALLSPQLVIQRSRVHHWLCRVVAAEHHKQVTHHSSLLIVIQIHNIIL